MWWEQCAFICTSCHRSVGDKHVMMTTMAMLMMMVLRTEVRIQLHLLLQVLMVLEKLLLCTGWYYFFTGDNVTFNFTKKSVNRLKVEQYVHTVPTIGFNCERVRGTLGFLSLSLHLIFITIIISLTEPRYQNAHHHCSMTKFTWLLNADVSDCIAGKSRGLTFLVWDVGGQEKVGTVVF